MKKLILSILTLASLSACKKDIVEPVTENIEVNRLPKRVYFNNSDSSNLDSSSYGEFIYNEKGLLKSFNNYLYSNKIGSFEYEYIGNNISKITCYSNDSIIYTNVNKFENNLLKSFSKSNSSSTKPETSYYYKNGIIDYILDTNIFDRNIDSISVTSNQNETIFHRYLFGKQSSPKSIHVSKSSYSILDSISSIPITYYYLNKPITLQNEVIDRLEIFEYVKGSFPYIYKLNLYKLILNAQGVNYSYSFDIYDRLTTIKSQYQEHRFDGSTQEVIKYSKIIY